MMNKILLTVSLGLIVTLTGCVGTTPQYRNDTVTYSKPVSQSYSYTAYDATSQPTLWHNGGMASYSIAH